VAKKNQSSAKKKRSAGDTSSEAERLVAGAAILPDQEARAQEASSGMVWNCEADVAAQAR
jgi:hypothetical protein